MQIETSPHSAYVLVRLIGRFDFSTRDDYINRIKRVIAEAEPPEIRMDMSRVDYIDSSALGMLLMTRDLAKQREREVSLASPMSAVRQTLETAQFGRLFRFV